MNIPFLTSFLKKEKKTLHLPSSVLVKQLKTITEANALIVYENTTIYHHKKSFFIPLLLLDKERGIYIFEHKTWSYDDLKNATIEKATQQSSSNETLAFEKSHDIIKQKFNELIHTDGVPLYNFLLMENLSADEYEHLDDSFKELLPSQKIIFSDTNRSEILKKLSAVSEPQQDLPDIADIMGNVLIQYCVLDFQNTLHMATPEQMQFIDANISGYNVLYSEAGSGKTSAVALKVIVEKLKNPKIKITIIEPTILSSDILKKKLMDIIEHAIIEIDITTIQILTPLELINMHLKKLRKPELHDHLYIETTLMNKKFNIADLLICDDSDLFSGEFIAYLKHIQIKSSLLLINNSNEIEQTFTLAKSFKKENQEVIFHQTSPHAKALQLISKLLKTKEAKDILVVSSNLSKEKLKDDLDSFIENKAILLDSSKNLMDQDLDNLLLSTYSDINGIHAKYIILMDVCFAKRVELEYAVNLSFEKTFVLYDEECTNIYHLRNNFENNKNIAGVEKSA
jgi:hypothetical protein